MSARRVRARPTVARRRVPRSKDSSSYQRTRAAVGLACFLLLFGLLWLLNGSFTAQFMQDTFRSDILMGWSVHFVMSAIEVAPVFIAPFLAGVPRPIRITIWLLSLPFGVLDVLSSAVGVAPWFGWTGVTGAWVHVQNTAIGEVIAFLPEPMLIWLLVALRTTLRGR